MFCFSKLIIKLKCKPVGFLPGPTYGGQEEIKEVDHSRLVGDKQGNLCTRLFFRDYKRVDFHMCPPETQKCI